MDRFTTLNIRRTIHVALKELAKELSEERGKPKDESLADVTAEAVKFFRENRPKPTNTQDVTL